MTAASRDLSADSPVKPGEVPRAAGPERALSLTAGPASRCPREVPPSRPALVSLGAALDAGAAPVLRERLIGELRRGPALLVLDLSHVSSCDVVGLAVLIGTQRRARQLGVSVRLAAPSPAAANALRSTGLEHSFTISQDRYGMLTPGLDGSADSAAVPGGAGRR